MERARNSWMWAEEGYNLFAEEGLDGIQVERLARILQLNKSGFYHYFGDLEVFCMELLGLHKKKANHYLADVGEVKAIVPDYLEAIVKHKVPVMFHVQLIRAANPEFNRVAEIIDQQEDLILRPVWADFIGFHDNPDLAIRYFDIVRDMFYTRMSLQNMNYPFLHDLVTEARVLMQEIAESKAAF